MDPGTRVRIEMSIILALMLFVMHRSTTHKRESWNQEDRVFHGLLWAVASLLLIDAVSIAFRGLPGSGVRVLLWTTNTVYFLLNILPPALFLIYAQLKMSVTSPTLQQHRAALRIVFAIWAGICLSGPWTGYLFTIGPDNLYRRGPGFMLSSLILYGTTAYSIAMISLHRDSLPKKEWWILLFYPFPPIVGGVLQQMFYGTMLLWPATVISLLMLALNLQNSRMGRDFLTGLQNRMSLMRHLTMMTANRSKVLLSGIALDLDGFKVINDRFGHAEGDRALIETAHVLRASIRSQDMVARLGGDEFIIILETDRVEELEAVVARVRKAFGCLPDAGSRPYRLSTSVGYCVYDPDIDREPGRFLARLDAALYEDKQEKERRMNSCEDND